MALAEDITRPWRQNMSRYLAETQLSAMFQARVSFLAYSQLKPLSLMPFWASSSINEPKSVLAWQLGLTFVISVVYKNN